MMTQAEAAAITATLLDPSTELDLMPEHFSTKPGEKIWLEIMKLRSMGEPVDGITLQNRLKSDQQALSALASAMQISASPSNASSYAGVVQEEAKRRQFQTLLKESLKHSKAEAPDRLAGELIMSLIGLNTRSQVLELNASELMARTLERIDQLSRGQQLGLRTGFRKLDQKLGGWHPGELSVIGARPAMGKSAFALSCAVKASQMGSTVGFISCEMDVLALGMRLAASAAGLSLQKIRTGQITEIEAQWLATASGDIAQLPLHFLEAPGAQMSQIVRTAHTWHRQGMRLLIVDYLQRIHPDRHAERNDLEIGGMAKEMKTLAAQLGIPVLLLAQLSRGVEGRPDKRPKMADLRDSGQIEQEADNLMFLYRDAVYNDSAPPEEAEVLIEKQRQGPTGLIRMHWDGETASWRDPDLPKLEAS